LAGRLILVLLTVFPLASAAPTAMAGSPSPTALYRALARTPVPVSQLPRGVDDAGIFYSTPPHGAIGEADLMLHPVAVLVMYVVFPSRAEALADFADESAALATAPPSGLLSLPKPLRFIRTRHETTTILVVRNVEVFPGGEPVSGSVSIALTKFAVHHLMQVERATR
jgi:hypothetical protein